MLLIFRAAGTDGHGAGPVTSNGLPQGYYLSWETLPEVLDQAGVTWRIYQDLAGATFAPDFGDGGASDNFDGNFTDNPVLYFAQYAASTAGSSLFDNGCTGTQLVNTQPPAGAPDSAWEAWTLSLFAQFKSDVDNGTLPQVSWIIAPSGYSEHPDGPMNYGAWFISQAVDILVSKPEVFSKTVFIVNYDEAGGGFDHLVPPSPPPTFPATAEGGASTVDFHNEIVTTSPPNGPAGLGTRVPCLVISPWSKGGYVNSQVFDHTSTIQFIEKRFGVYERNISPWRRAVCGDLTSVFDFRNPNHVPVKLPSTDAYLPPVPELSDMVGPPDLVVTIDNVLIGVPPQEPGIRPARSLPYELHVAATVDATKGTVVLYFANTGAAGAVFQVRPGNTTDPVRHYTVEAGKSLSGKWAVSGSYKLTVHGPNGFVRQFVGTVDRKAAVLDLRSEYGTDNSGSISLSVRNSSSHKATVRVLDAYTGESFVRDLDAGEKFESEQSLADFHGWYDFVVTVDEDAAFSYRLAGHVETGRDSKSDPAMGGLVSLKA